MEVRILESRVGLLIEIETKVNSLRELNRRFFC
jgi:hypothetical protein